MNGHHTYFDDPVVPWWGLLARPTQDWLIAHNGEDLPPVIVTEILAVTGGRTDAAWWAGPDQLTDAACDWILPRCDLVIITGSSLIIHSCRLGFKFSDLVFYF